MDPLAKMLRLQSSGALLAVCMAGVLSTGCAGIETAIVRYESLVPEQLVIVLPEGRRESGAVERYAEAKRQLGYSLSWIEFDLSLEPSQRLAAVRAGLPTTVDERRFVLILASPSELPMGPWSVEGLDGQVESDLPLFFDSIDQDEVLTLERWCEAGDIDFPWYVGRIPFEDEAVIEAALVASTTYAERANRLALLGSERFAIWGDSAWIMSRARHRFRDDWQVLTLGEDPPSDVRLGGGLERARLELDALAAIPAGALEGAESPEDLEFALCWASLSPSLVYLNSHGTAGFGGLIGHYLLSAWKLEQLGIQAEAKGFAGDPSAPAILVSVACQAGPPDSDLTRWLFERGWVAAMVGSTELTAPVPLWPAVRAEIETASVLDSSLPIAMAMQLFRSRYLEDADDSFSFLLSGSVRADVAKNILGMTLYGDPTLRLPGAPRGAGSD